jgi:transposase-like protein
MASKERDEAAAVVGRLRWTDTEASAVLSAVDESGLSVSEFATQHGLDRQRLDRWRRKQAARVPSVTRFDSRRSPSRR